MAVDSERRTRWWAWIEEIIILLSIFLHCLGTGGINSFSDGCNLDSFDAI